MATLREGVVEPVSTGDSAALSLLGPQQEIPYRLPGNTWDIAQCEKFAIDKVGIPLHSYRAYLTRVYGSCVDLDTVMLLDQKDVLLNAARDSMVREGLLKAIMGAARKP